MVSLGGPKNSADKLRSDCTVTCTKDRKGNNLSASFSCVPVYDDTGKLIGAKAEYDKEIVQFSVHKFESSLFIVNSIAFRRFKFKNIQSKMKLNIDLLS